MFKLFADFRKRLHQQRVEKIIRDMHCRPVVANEPLFLAFGELQNISTGEKWIRPHVFEKYNQAFEFDIQFCFFNSRSITEVVQKQLNSIITSEKAGEQEINFKWIEGLSASKSAIPENFSKWDSFYQFGQYAYKIHLRHYRDLDTEESWQMHYDALVQFFEYLLEKRHGIYAIQYQSWCGRYYLVNSGVSRRSAACAYMAKRDDPKFDRLAVFPVEVETINWEAIQHIERIADSYVVLASNQFHQNVEKFAYETNTPLGVCATRWNRNHHQDKDVRLYLLLHDRPIQETMNLEGHYSDQAKRHYEACLFQRDKLKPQLDKLEQHSLSVSLPQYVALISDVWRAACSVK